MTDFNLRAARIQLGALLVALVVAILIALGITTGAFVLSFAVQRDLARQALIPEHLTWIFPAIVDSAIFGATIAIVILSKLKVSRWDKRFYIALAVGVVAISILGNAYHAFHAAVAAQATVDSGGVLGFVPLAPAVAAAIAIIPPVLVLAFTHGVGILIKAIGAAHAQYSELVRSDDHTLPVHEDLDTAVYVSAAAEVAPIETAVDVAPTEGVASDSVDITTAPAVAPVVAAVAPTDATQIASESAAAEFVSEPVQAEPQTVAQLLAFIDHSDLDPMVKATATLKITNPDLTFAELAERTNVRAASTAMRRYNRAEDAAIAAGFTIPPLPTLDDVAREALESERNDSDQQVDLEAQLVHS
ncbi:DUF2637 domain-containing protein [Rhodococcus qingshengii]|uniref:DUF2637 domain-containing protein n=1 Tax=Rhodococcus qingshengii TaxID=334542 RepID=UPI0010A632D5|nr:DUF2637 domain-containing protein [Rhodococcus qingshengii]THJ70178.1 DUF2637 domain-containing protein [Rhodococcus qingshengii]